MLLTEALASAETVVIMVDSLSLSENAVSSMINQ